jgi:uracil-DNA glycosylase family 4
LTPIWRLRDRANAAPAEEPAVGPSPMTSDTPAVTRQKPVLAPDRRQDPSNVEASLVTRHSSLVTGSDDRRHAIMSMDWAALKARVAGCTDCPLHQKRTKTVFGVGDENADWLFVGEGPGAEEDAKGEPFVGQAGRLLDSMLAAIKLKRGANAYIANVVKCRPPGNRNPEPAEAQACEPYLHRQIELIRPKLIIALGKVAALNLLATDASIASLRGRLHEYRGIPLIVTYHPAYLLRSLPEKAKAWEDLCFAVRAMRDLQSGAAAHT